MLLMTTLNWRRIGMRAGDLTGAAPALSALLVLLGLNDHLRFSGRGVRKLEVRTDLPNLLLVQKLLQPHALLNGLLAQAILRAVDVSVKAQSQMAAPE